jgi:hypothetical protein
MKTLLPIASYIGLGLVIGAPLAYLAGSLDKGTMTTLMLIGTIIWFVTVPFWMGRNAGGEV